MIQNNLQKSISKIIESCKKNKDIDIKELREPIRVIGNNKISGIACGYFIKLIGNLKEKYTDYYEYKDIENLINNFFKKLILNAENNNQVTKNLIKFIDKEKNDCENNKISFIIPIDSLEIDLKEKKLKMGSVKFIQINQLKSECSNFRTCHFFKNYNKKTIFAKITTKGTIHKAKNQALESIEEALNILKLYFTNIQGRESSQIGLKGELAIYNRHILMIKSEKTYTESLSTVGAGLPSTCIIDNRYLNDFKKLGFSKIISILNKKEEKNEYEKLLLTAIHWYGKAVNTIRIADRFVMYIIALESILGPKGDYYNFKTYTANISEKGAFLLADYCNKRIEVQKTLKQLYSKRGSISHGGNSKIDHKAHQELQFYTANIIFKSINISNKFKNKKEFNDYFMKLALTTPAVPKISTQSKLKTFS